MQYLRHFAPALSFFLSFSSATFAATKCGTAEAAQRWMTLRASGQKPSARISVGALPAARTLNTTHFAIHYSLAPDVNRVKLVAGDAPLKTRTDSVFQSLSPSWSFAKRDSALHATLDTLKAPHPLFVQRAAVYFERAYDYYVGALSMTAPKGSQNTPNQFFDVPPDGSRFTVDIGDIETLYGSGEYYGLTFIPASSNVSSNILLENDFLWNAHWDDPSSSVIGQPIQSILNGQVLHDYNVQWDLGIKITASHEFYHGIQYGYTPTPGTYHAWYELSATGMEERLVPESEDYFQYLPSVLLRHETVSLLTPPSTENYGNGIFHQFLTLEFGNGFDTKVWSALKSNGNDLPLALTTMTSSFGALWDTVYSSYAASVATAGRAGSTATCRDSTAPIFTRDLRCWPTPTYDTLPGLGSSKTLKVPALTFRLLKPATNAIVGAMHLTGLKGGRLVQKNGTGYSNLLQNDSDLILMQTPDSSVLALAVANGSFAPKDSAKILISTRSATFVAFPNPVNLSSGNASFYAPPGSMNPLALTVVSESGRRVAELVLNAAQGSWSWNLKDQQGRTVPPGAYHYRIPNQPNQSAKTLLILPP